MLKYVNYSVVFQEVPDEVTLAINISGCPNDCKGCHSAYLKEEIGEILNQDVISVLLNKYENAVTCICFMGGDSDPKTVEHLSLFVRETAGNQIKTAWYSGKSFLPQNCLLGNFDYIKLGPYIESLGGLDSPITNQKFYKIDNGKMTDITVSFQKKMAYYTNE